MVLGRLSLGAGGTWRWAGLGDATRLGLERCDLVGCCGCFGIGEDGTEIAVGRLEGSDERLDRRRDVLRRELCVLGELLAGWGDADELGGGSAEGVKVIGCRSGGCGLGGRGR